MKKIFLGLFALALMSTGAFASGGKKKAKKAKAKTACTTVCTDPKDCKITPNCTPLPGCCKM